MRHRNEIDGLRAVAVAAVVLFHAGFTWFSGGYIGVDIFFVISGYLITHLIISEKAAGTFSFPDFYERRARRIIPALFLVILCCIPFALFWMLPYQYLDFSKSVASVVALASNFYFWDQGTYFAPAAGERPLLHAWSLSLEEQFYAFYPLFLVLIWKFGQRVIFYVVFAFAIAGVGLSEYGWRHHPDATFYLPHARVWELDIGALCAIAQINRPLRGSNILSAVGLGLVGVPIVAFDDATPFPSLYALLPTIGAALVLLYGREGTWTARFLSARPMVGIGLISYSAYLWHQPLFAFARLRSLVEPPLSLMAVLAAASFALAYSSWKFVEQPIRLRGGVSWLGRRPFLIGLSLFLAFFLAVAYQGMSGDGVNFANIGQQRKLQAMFGKQPVPLSDCKFGDPEISKYFQICRSSNAPHRRKIAVIGDSHAGAVFPAFYRVAREKGFDALLIDLGGCPPLLSAYIHRGNYPSPVCELATRRQFELARAGGVDMIFLVARWSLYDSSTGHYLVSDSADGYERDPDRYDETVLGLLRETIAAYRRAGMETFLVSQPPQQDYDATQIYRRIVLSEDSDAVTDEFVRQHSVSVARHHATQARITALLQKLDLDGNHLIDLSSEFCGEQLCLMGDHRRSLYFDRDHLSPNGAEVAYQALAKIFASF